MPTRFAARLFSALLSALLFCAGASPGVAAQTVLAVDPPGGTLGSEVVIHGQDFGSSRAGLAVWLSVDGKARRAPLRILSVQPDHIVARIVRLRPGTEAALHVARRGGDSDVIPFAVEAPVITGVSPLAVTPGQTVTVTGQHFGSRAPRVLLFDKGCKVVSWSDTELAFRVPRGVPDGEWTPRVANKVGEAFAPQSLQLSGSNAPPPPARLILRAGDFSMAVDGSGIASAQVGGKIAIDAVSVGAQTQQLSILVPFLAHSSPVPSVLSGTGFGSEPFFYVVHESGNAPGSGALYTPKPGQLPWEVVIFGRSHGLLSGRLSGVLELAAGNGPAQVEIQQGQFTAAF